EAPGFRCRRSTPSNSGMGGSGNRGNLSMGVSIHGEPQPDDGWMYGLLLLRIHSASSCPTTAVVRRWAIRSIRISVVIKPFDKWTTQGMMSTATKCCKFVLEPPQSLFGEFDSIQVCPSTKLLKFLKTKLR